MHIVQRHDNPLRNTYDEGKRSTIVFHFVVSGQKAATKRFTKKATLARLSAKNCRTGIF